MSISIEYQCGPYNVCGQFGRKETLLNGLQVFISFFKNVVFYVNARPSKNIHNSFERQANVVEKVKTPKKISFVLVKRFSKV